MDTAKYYLLGDSDNDFSRTRLEQTLKALEEAGDELKKEVETSLDAQPINKPALHSGGPESDYFRHPPHYAALLDRCLQYVESA